MFIFPIDFSISLTKTHTYAKFEENRRKFWLRTKAKKSLPDPLWRAPRSWFWCCVVRFRGDSRKRSQARWIKYFAVIQNLLTELLCAARLRRNRKSKMGKNVFNHPRLILHDPYRFQALAQKLSKIVHFCNRLVSLSHQEAHLCKIWSGSEKVFWKIDFHLNPYVPSVYFSLRHWPRTFRSTFWLA